MVTLQKNYVGAVSGVAVLKDYRTAMLIHIWLKVGGAQVKTEYNTVKWLNCNLL